MSVDASLLGTHTAAMLDLLDTIEGELVAVAIVAVTVGDAREDTHVVTSAEQRFERIGLLEAALESARAADKVEPIDDELDDVEDPDDDLPD